MAGSSPGTSSDAHEACLSPCNRGCAPRECRVVLPKPLSVYIRCDKVEKRDYLELNFPRNGKEEYHELSIANFVRSVSKCGDVEEVVVYGDRYGKCSVETWKTLCKTLETISSLNSLKLCGIDTSRLSIQDGEAIFKVLGVHNTLKKCHVGFVFGRPLQITIMKMLVDNLLQNDILQDFSLDFTGHGRTSILSAEEAHESNGIIGELGRYMEAPTNVLTELSTRRLNGDELVQLANLLGDNKQLRRLIMGSLDTQHCEGIIAMGKGLKTNIGMEELVIIGITMGGKEMKSLVEALIPDITSGIQPNTHLNCLALNDVLIEDGDGMEQFATLLRLNISMTSLRLIDLKNFGQWNENVDENVENLFNSLCFNASLEELDLRGCNGIGGKRVLGMIMDMLLHNHTLRKIHLEGTRLEEDGGAEVVYAEMRTRGPTNEKLAHAIRSLEHLPPNSARVFLCGDPKAGKTTLCNKWKEIADMQAKLPTPKKKKNMLHKLYSVALKKSKKPIARVPRYAQLFDISERTRGIEVHNLVWEGMHISLWDMAGQLEYHAFHDLVVPNQSAKGEGCYYFVVCDPTKYNWNDRRGNPSSKLEVDIEYWLLFLASNTRHSASYRPHVTILMTHHDMWQGDNILQMVLKKIVSKLKSKFQQVLDFDQDLDFISMDNEKSCDHAEIVKRRVEQYLKQLSSKLPKVLKASLEFQSIVSQWCLEHDIHHILKWEEFSRDLFEHVEELKPWKNNDDETLEKLKKHIAKSLHSGGHIMYFENVDLVIMNPHWFCNHVIGNILFNCSRLNQACDGDENGKVSHEDFIELCKDVLGLDRCKDHYEDTLEIMKKLQICYEDYDDKIMIPSLLTDAQDSMGWGVAFHNGTQSFNFVGTRLTSKDDTITLPSEGFYPRLQVYLHEKYDMNTYKIYLNIISFIYNDINVFITRKDGSINIMSQSSTRDGDHAHHALHKMIINHINDLRQKPSLGCPGVIFEEHSIWPRCVELPFNRKLQSVSKRHLKEMVLRTGDLKYVYQWIDEKNCGEAVLARKLLGQEEWHKIMEYRDQMVKEMDKALDQQLATSSEVEQGLSSSTSETRGEPLNNDCQQVVIAKLDSMKRLIQCNHNEVMERLNEMELRIIHSQEALASRLCSNIDHVMKYSLHLKNSKIPKLPYIVELDESKKRWFLLKAVPGLKRCHLRFRCEHNDYGFHTIEDQGGLEIHIGTENTRRFGTVLFWGLVTTTMLLKVGAHLVAPGMGNMVPVLAKGLATILDTPGLLDLAQPRGPILECLPAEFKSNPVISLEDNDKAKEWLVKMLETKRESIYEMFKLTEVAYVSRSSKKREIGWVCDRHK